MQKGGVHRREPVEVSLCHLSLKGTGRAAACPTRRAPGTWVGRGGPTMGVVANTVEKLLLAAPRGYCAGVDRAVQTVERALAIHGAPLYVRKGMGHNKGVGA